MRAPRPAWSRVELRATGGRGRFTGMNEPLVQFVDTDESQLVERLRAGDDAAYAWLVRRFTAPLLSVIRRILPRAEDAHDAVQDAFLAAFKALPDFDGRAQFGSWLHRIAINAALSKLRALKRRPEQAIEELLPTFVADGHRDQPGPAWTVTAPQEMERAEVRQLVRQSIDRLPEPYRLVLVLRDIEDLDTETVAQQLGIEPGAVKTRLHRARQALRTLLDPHFRGDRT